tara:strand:- start:30000 stop:30317 length:318 start_codon:yes stop_codon:yes gene_type:complete
MPKTPVFKFKLIRGRHNDGAKTYKPGDIIESSSDLSLHDPQQLRFVPILENVAVAPVEKQESTSDGYSEMTVAELRSYADEGEIDLSGCHSKAAIIARIKDEESE